MRGRWAAVVAPIGAAILPALAASPAPEAPRAAPATPIEHLIVVIGENQTFDAVFATYLPPSGQSIRNLLSAGIVLADGSPGPNFGRAEQHRALGGSRYSIDPPRTDAYASLPRPTLIGVTDADFHLVGHGPDERIPAGLPSGPFPVSRYIRAAATEAPPTLAAGTLRLSAATGDPVHRFFQMWQQCGAENRSLDLFTWVAVTAGMGGDTRGVLPEATGQGGELMGFENMAAGDVAGLRELADHYALSDNYHQPMMGGTGMNFFMLVTGDVPYYTQDARPAVPPVNQIEDPDPRPGTENFYRRDGYEGGSYAACADRDSPGVGPILAALERHGLAGGCEPGHYYLLNNYAPGYGPDGRPQPQGPYNFSYPPQSIPTIAEALSRHGVSWKWYIGGHDTADVLTEIRTLHLPAEAARRAQFNADGNPLAASGAVMTTPALRARIQGIAAFDRDLARGSLPAVSFVVPKNRDSGHPGYSVVASYQSLVRDIVQRVQARPRLWSHAAVVAIMDEGGGHFDSGYIQMLDFFGDGPRVPLLVISPYARRGHVDHVYNDHASILKFIERNWHLAPLSGRSRDRLPDPIATASDPYRPGNAPAIGDLTSLFDF